MPLDAPVEAGLDLKLDGAFASEDHFSVCAKQDKCECVMFGHLISTQRK